MDCDVDDEIGDDISWDEECKIFARYNDEVYNERVYEQWEIKDNQILFMIGLLQRRNEAMTPLEKVMHDVPNSDCKYHYITINHPKPNCKNQQELERYLRYDKDGYINEASSWMNGALTNQFSDDEEYDIPGYPAQQELELIMDDKVYQDLYEQHRNNQRSQWSKEASTNQQNHNQRCEDYENSYKFPLESEEYKSFHLKLEVQAKTKEV